MVFLVMIDPDCRGFAIRDIGGTSERGENSDIPCGPADTKQSYRLFVLDTCCRGNG